MTDAVPAMKSSLCVCRASDRRLSDGYARRGPIFDFWLSTLASCTTFACINACMCVFMYERMYVRMYVCMNACMYACIYV